MERYKQLVKEGLEATPEPSSGEWEGAGTDIDPIGFHLTRRERTNAYRVHAIKQGNSLTAVHIFPD
jgi:hypothetical protein